MKIGILGGSFDPIHKGHLAVARFAREELNLDRVIFVPVGKNPLKKNPRSLSDAARLVMIQKKLKHSPGFSVSTHEFRKNGPSYTVDTLRYFRKKFSTKTQLYFLAGADTVKDFSRWKSPATVLKLCRFVVMTRPGTKMRTNDGRFLWLPMPPVRISSTSLRKNTGRSLKGD